MAGGRRMGGMGLMGLMGLMGRLGVGGRGEAGGGWGVDGRRQAMKRMAAVAVCAAWVVAAIWLGGCNRVIDLIDARESREELRARAVAAMAEVGGPEALGREAAVLIRRLREGAGERSLEVVPDEVMGHLSERLKANSVAESDFPALAAVNRRLGDSRSLHFVEVVRDGDDDFGRTPPGAVAARAIIWFGTHANYGRLYVFDPAEADGVDGGTRLERLEGCVFFLSDGP